MRFRASRTQDRRWTRAVPLTRRTPQHLAARKLATGCGDHDLCFRREPNIPFVRSAVAQARAAWKQAGLQPITRDEARHTCASYLIAAGIGDLCRRCSGTPTCGPPRTCTVTCCRDAGSVGEHADAYLAATKVPWRHPADLRIALGRLASHPRGRSTRSNVLRCRVGSRRCATIHSM
jgi:hypothetical protein